MEMFELLIFLQCPYLGAGWPGLYSSDATGMLSVIPGCQWGEGESRHCHRVWHHPGTHY
jgi:hypothetical protein